MIKTKKNIVHAPLVVTGYVLFSLLVVATLISITIPWGIMLFDPRVMRFNVTVFAIALTVGSILPVLLGYVIGDRSVKSKSKLSHHFNGMLFGLLAFWLMTLVSVFVTIPDGLLMDVKARVVLMSLLPGIGVAIVATILAIAHVRSEKARQDIIEYQPFSATLIVAALVLPLWSLGSSIVAGNVDLSSFVALAIVALLGLVSYASLRKTKLSKYSRAVWSAVSVSVAFVMLYVLLQFVHAVAVYLQPMPTMEEQAIVSALAYAFSLTGWLIYWRKQVRALR